MTINITPDLSRIPNLAERQEAERLFLAESASETALANIENAVLEASPEVQAAKAANNAAGEAYGAHPLTLMSNYCNGDNIARCALSGMPLIDGDDVLECSETGQQVLRCLVLAPVPAEADKAGDDETEDAAE
ncbi:MAG: hypothetical protein ABL901_01085 [Hyphomicrobiaceae bacterium]